MHLNEENLPDGPDVPDGLTPAARRARKEFYKAYSDNLKRKEQFALKILVWGPHFTDPGPVAQKRRDIRAALRAAGHFVAFSEEISHATGDDEIISLKYREFSQALAADLIVVLVEDSPGAIAEAHDFCNHPELATKFLIMFPSALRSGYSAQGAIRLIEEGFGGVHYYEPDEILECQVLSRAVACAEARRLVYVFVGREP